MIEPIVCEQILNLDVNTPAVLCSLVEWKGSVPRKDYPAMLVTAEAIYGTVGGGKMEFDVITQARALLSKPEIRLEKYELTNKDALEEGSLCGGTTRIVLEPFSVKVRSFYEDLSDQMKIGTGNLVTKIPLDETTHVDRKISNEDVDRPQSKVEDGFLKLTEPIVPVTRFHIFGAGHVGKAVADLAHFIDLHAVVYDDRPDLLTRDRFPNADHVSLNYDKTFDDQIVLNRTDLVLIATPGHFHDLDLLRWILGQDCTYAGLISSKRKWSILRGQLIREGIAEARADWVHSPVGLNIEAETVPEIAVSILAEVILHLRKKGKDTAKLHEF